MPTFTAQSSLEPLTLPAPPRKRKAGNTLAHAPSAPTGGRDQQAPRVTRPLPSLRPPDAPLTVPTRDRTPRYPILRTKTHPTDSRDGFGRPRSSAGLARAIPGLGGGREEHAEGER